MTMPFLTSFTGTKSCAGLGAGILFGFGARILYIERPGEVVEPVPGEAELRARRRLNGHGRRRCRSELFFGLRNLFPEVEASAREVDEARFEDFLEGLIVQAIERKRAAERDDREAKDYRDEERKREECYSADADGSGDVDELL